MTPQTSTMPRKFMSLRRLHLAFAFVLCLLPTLSLTGCATETPAEHAANVYAADELAAAPPDGNLPDYSLPPDKLIKAQQIFHIGNKQILASTVWDILLIIILLASGAVARMRDLALRFSSNRWLQAYTFLLLFLLATFVLNLPLRLFSHHLGLAYGFSVQSWLSWFADQAKTLLLTWIIGGLLVMLLFAIIRRFPQRWWLVFALASIPISIAGLFATPYVIDPLFNHFEPLQNSNPALVAQLERIVARGHLDIPPSRMFLMKASAKTTTLNAYVTGFGASKRVVIWDTSIAKASPDEILFIFGHESGHYVLHHIVLGLLGGILGSFLILYLAAIFLRWSLARFGTAWRIPSQQDWGALAILLLAAALLNALGGPVQKYFSRNLEHAADVYGQEAVHGIVADPQLSGKNAFHTLGVSILALPNESALIEALTEDHPAIGRRAAFAKAYDPWAPGMDPKYFKK